MRIGDGQQVGRRISPVFSWVARPAYRIWQLAAASTALGSSTTYMRRQLAYMQCYLGLLGHRSFTQPAVTVSVTTASRQLRISGPTIRDQPRTDLDRGHPPAAATVGLAPVLEFAAVVMIQARTIASSCQES